METQAESNPTKDEKSPRKEAATSARRAVHDTGAPTDVGPPADYVHDIRLMLEHCRRKGIVLPQNIQDSIDLVYGEPPGQRPLKELIKLHGLLCQIVAPATPCSLAATTFSREAAWTIGFIASMMLAALIGMVGYLWTLPPIEDPNASPSGAAKEARPTTDAPALVSPIAHRAVLTAEPTAVSPPSAKRARNCVNYLFAAIVGSAFYSLLTAYGYLRKRTFDPSYVTTYVIRFTLGILAGVVLASFGAELLKNSEEMSKLGPGILALLGGYSAQAVRLVLDRFVEVLATAVKGRDGFSEQRAVVATDLISILQTASGNPATPVEVKDKLDTLLKKLQQ